MIKRLIIALVFSLFVYTREAYAVFDFIATLESQLENVPKKLGKGQEIMKKVTDTYTRAKRGFDAANGCIKNPRSCFAKFLTVTGQAGLTKIALMEGVDIEPNANLLEISSDEFTEKLEEGGVYKKGQDDTIAKNQELKAQNNAVVVNDIASLWAKSISTRQEILKENDDEQYKEALSDTADMEKLLASQQTLSLLSAKRVNRILELQSYMISGQSTHELKGHSNPSEEDSGE